MPQVRVAIVSPYSWTYPGGVTRHIEALAGELVRTGHEVRVLAPFDPDDRRTAVLPRGARAAEVRPRRPRGAGPPPRRPPAGPRDPGLVGAARRHPRLALQRRRVE